MENLNNPDIKGTEGQKVIVEGREFSDYKTAAEEMGKSYEERRGAFDKKEEEMKQENAHLKADKETLETEKAERLAQEKADAESKKTPPSITPIDWTNDPEGQIQAMIDAGVEKKLAKEREAQRVANMSSEERTRQEQANKEVAIAQAEHPELNDLKLTNRIGEEVFAGLIPDKVTETLTKRLAKHPEAIRKAGGNRLLLAYYCLLKEDGTLGDKLKTEPSETTGKGTTLESSKNTVLKKGMTDKEWNNLPQEKRDEIMRKEMEDTEIPTGE